MVIPIGLGILFIWQFFPSRSPCFTYTPRIQTSKHGVK